MAGKATITFFILSMFSLGNGQVLHHHPDHLHNPVHAEIITKHFGDTDVQFEHDVIILTKDNFYYMVGAHEILLALFGVPWDPKFNEILLEFEKAAGILQKEHPSICLGRMDVSGHPEITKKMDIRGDEPQFMFFYKNRAYSFEHSWKAEAIVKELVKRQEAIWYPPQNLPEQILEVAPKDLEKVANHDFAVVLLYSPTRLLSLRNMMELENAAAVLNRTDVFFKINVADVKDLRNEFGIPPVLKIFRRGKAYDYKGPKVTKGMVNYLRGQMQPPFFRGLSGQDVEDFLTKHQDKPTVLGYFENEKMPQFNLFVEAGNILRGELHFVMIRQFMSSPGWKSKLPEENWRIGVILPKRDSDPEIVEMKDVTMSIENLKTLEELMAFIQFKAVPVVGHRTKKNKDGFLYNRKPLLIAYMKVDWSKTGEKETLYIRHRVATVAVQYPISKMTFVMSDIKEFKDEVDRFGFTDLDEEKEVRIGIIGKDGEYYPFRTTERITYIEIKQFAEDYLAGKLLPYYRSEKPLPMEENTDPVKVVSAATFPELVLKSPKETLISFCHPLCAVCETVEKTLVDVAKNKEYPTLDILAMDTSLNDPPAVYVPKTYPALYFASDKNKTAPIRYNGRDFSVKELHKFLDKHVSQPRVLSKSEL